MFTTPLLRSLAASFPEAEIDVLMRGRANAVLLAGLPGVRHTFVLHGGLRSALMLIRRLRRRRYDLAVLPVAGSSSDRFAALACGASRRLGFAGSDQWLRLSHSAARPAEERHQGRIPLALLSGGLADTPVSHHPYLSVMPGAEARAAADRAWRAALGESGGPVLGFFTRATGSKQLSADWWRDWLAAIRAAPEVPLLLQVLPGEGAPTLAPEIPGVHLGRLDELAALIGRMDAFVAGDCGPMHLAAAAGTPTLGLFAYSDPARYAPLGPGCASLVGEELVPARAAERSLALLRTGRAHAAGG